jgi:hypothetical protein
VVLVGCCGMCAKGEMRIRIDPWLLEVLG